MKRRCLEVLRFLRAQTGHDFAPLQARHHSAPRRAPPAGQPSGRHPRLSRLSAQPIPPKPPPCCTTCSSASPTSSAMPTRLPRWKVTFPSSLPTKPPAIRCACGWRPARPGEEAYSVAMLLLEHAARLETPPTIQVFATDLDEDAIQVARAGLYPATIEADVSPERLRRFFHKEEGRYRVKKELRERVLFSAHNLLKDSPFSRLDLVTCRNLLIYLKREAQEAVLRPVPFCPASGRAAVSGQLGKRVRRPCRCLPRWTDSIGCLCAAPRRAPGWQLPALPVACSFRPPPSGSHSDATSACFRSSDRERNALHRACAWPAGTPLGLFWRSAPEPAGTVRPAFADRQRRL